MEDVIIIGGGVCGCSLLYELSRRRLAALLLEKENDVACGATKANSAIIHAGYDPKPGTAMSRFNVEGAALIETLAADLDIPYKKTGSLVVGFDENDRKTIGELYERGVKNGVQGLRILQGEQIFSMEPAISRKAQYALWAPSAAVIAPWELASAQAECAVAGGAKIELDCEVRAIDKRGSYFSVTTNRGVYEGRYLVNAAGVDSDVISRMIEPAHFTITPKQGEYFILDTTEADLVKTIVFPCPSKLGKGVLITPTVHGNIIVGPDSKDHSRHDVSTSAAGLDYVRTNALRCVPSINFRASIRNYAGIRAEAGLDDFIVGESKECSGFFNIAGIKSPGLSSAPAIAKEIAGLLREKGLPWHENPNFAAKRTVIRFKELDDAGKARIVAENPRYGAIACRCNTITEGEILDALRRPLPPRSLDAVKRRCTAGMGRCQGGFCGHKTLALISGELGIPPQNIPQDRAGMYLISGFTKGGGG